MFRSIQSKLVLVYLLLVLVAMQFSGVYLLKELEGAYVRKVQDDLHQSAQLLVGQLTNYINGGELETEGIASYVSHWPYHTLVLDKNGTVIGLTPGHGDLMGKKFSHDDVSPALVGQETARVGLEDEERMAFQAVPITSAGQVVGVVYLKTSLTETYDRLRNIRDVLLMAVAMALGATGVLGVALARTITEPVRELTRKAAAMAGGQFDQTIQVRSDDEIGQLGEMFNRMSLRLQETLEEIRGEKDKVEAILSHMADGLLALDGQGRIIKLNPAAQWMLQAEESDVLGLTPADVWPEMNLDTFLSQAREENRSVAQEIHVGPMFLIAYVTPLRGEGSPGTVVVLRDITEMEKLESMRREFLQNVSHELKTPLTTVKSYVETLLDGAADDPDVRMRFLQVVQSETERMARLVRDLLRLSQLEQGIANWDIEPEEITSLVEECIAKLSVQSERKQLTINCTYAPDLPLGLCDRDKLQQVLLNLLANAVEFTPPGGEITVRVETQGDMVRVAVKDTGIGIPQEDLSRIFERFYRVDKARSRMLGGTGLGLAIAREIVQLLGGTMVIHSELGMGTEVAFTIPAVQDVDTGWV